MGKSIQVHSKTVEEIRAPFGLYPQGLKQATWALSPESHIASSYIPSVQVPRGSKSSRLSYWLPVSCIWNLAPCWLLRDWIPLEATAQNCCLVPSFMMLTQIAQLGDQGHRFLESLPSPRKELRDPGLKAAFVNRS